MPRDDKRMTTVLKCILYIDMAHKSNMWWCAMFLVQVITYGITISPTLIVGHKWKALWCVAIFILLIPKLFYQIVPNNNQQSKLKKSAVLIIINSKAKQII